MPDYLIPAGDLSPSLVGTLTYADGTVPTGIVAVTLVLRNPEASIVYLTGTCTFVLNVVTYVWQTGDTAVPGDYVGEFQVTFADGSEQSFPTAGYFTLSIEPSLVGTLKPRPPYLTTQDLIWQVRGYLDGRQRPVRNRLSGDISSSVTSFPLRAAVNGAVAGAQLGIGLETMYIWASSGSTLSDVERGADGTVASQHADGDVVLVNPEFTDGRIFQAINQELAALPSAGIYNVKSLDTFINSRYEGYDLATDVEKVVDVRFQHRWDPSNWAAVASWDVQFGMPLTSFPSGIALFLPDRPYSSYTWNYLTDENLVDDGTNTYTDQYALRVRYFANLTALAGLFDDVVGVSGIPSSATDIVAMGAAIRLMSGRPIQRVANLAQADPRNNLETKASDVLNAPAALRQQYQTRLDMEADKLRGRSHYLKPARRLMG